MNLGGLAQTAARIREKLEAKYAARERALPLAREAIRSSANAIRAAHRGEFEPARSLLNRVRAALDEAEAVLAAHPDIYYAGFIHDAQKEYAEGCITLAAIAGEPLPDPEALGVSYPAYLNGLGEAIGELRRHLLDLIRDNALPRCEEILALMDDFYGLLVTIDFPEAMTGGLRRTTDAARAILERTRGDLTLALRQHQLERRMASLQDQLEE